MFAHCAAAHSLKVESSCLLWIIATLRGKRGEYFTALVTVVLGCFQTRQSYFAKPRIIWSAQNDNSGAVQN